MKTRKTLIIISSLFLLTGCGKDKMTCTYTNKDVNYKNETTLEITFEDKKVFNFVSNISEEYDNEYDANNAYIKYQNDYENYNENNIVSEYSKDNLKISAKYTVTFRNIEENKVQLPFDLSQQQNSLISELTNKGYKCK